MDARQVLYTTRAMRRVKPDPVPHDTVARIVDAGLRAPAPGAQQTWRFVVVTERATMARIGVIWRRTRNEVTKANPNLYSSPIEAASSQYLHDHFDDLPLAIFGYGPELIGSRTVIPALWTMCLAARNEGVGSTFTSLLCRVQTDVDDVLGVPTGVGLILFGVLPMGFPRGRWGVARRQPVEEVVFMERWGNPPKWGAVELPLATGAAE